MKELVHVKIGSVNEVLPVIALYEEGCFKDIYELRTPKGRCWVHKRWCKPVLPQQSDTDWRGFLKNHWDNERGHCSVDSLDEFMRIFNRAASDHQNKNNNEQISKANRNDQETTDRVSDSGRGSGSDSTAAKGDKRGIRKTDKQVKARTYVELSLFPDF